MTTLHLDFESRATVDLKKTGVHKYATHPETDVWCCAWAIDDGPVRVWRPGEPLPDDLRDVLENGTVGAFNANFEWHIIEYICAPRYGWPRVAPERLDDTAARAAVQSLPRDLAGAAKALGLAVEKDDKGRRLMLQMMKPRKPRKDEDPEGLYWWDDEGRRARLEQYCVRDVEVERELDRVLLSLTDSEKKIWLLDFRANHRGIAVDLELVREADKVLKHSLAEYGRRLSRLTNGRVTTVTNHAALTAWLQDNDIATDSVGKEAVTAMLDGDLPDHVRKVLTIRQEAAKSSTAKLKSFMLRTSDDGRMRDNLMYHGAGTGRWTAKGVQLQNLPRPSISKRDVLLAVEIIKDTSLSVADRAAQLEFLIGPVLTVISDILRSVLVAEAGKQLDVADYANIEGRVNAWGAGQDDKVELFRTGGKIYERMAAAIYGIPAGSVTKDSDERFLGKTAELGCGYQMGPGRFRDTCAEQGVEISAELAERTVETYREVNGRIKAFWYGLESTAIEAMRSPGVVAEYRGIQYLLPTQDMPGYGFLLARLPSGRCLFYPSPELRPTRTPWGEMKEQLTYMGVNQQTRKWERQSTYGGKLVENVVQAIARDLLAAAMYRLERAGYPIVLTVHDEIVAETPAGFGDAKEFERLMAKVPKWAAGCPVAVEGYRATRYRK